MNSALIIMAVSFAIFAIAECQEEQITTTTESKVVMYDEEEVKTHASPGKQTRQDAKIVATMMLEQVGLPFLSWPAFGIIKDTAKSLLGVGKREKVPVLEDEYDYEQASLKTKSDKLKIVKTAKN